MKYAYEITEYECVGDALGKINYNFLNLESQICQLSAMYFSGNDNFLTSMLALSAIIKDLDFIGNEFSQASLYRQAYTATNLLSSYWNKNEMTIEYPLNLNTVNQVKNFQIDGITQNATLIAIAKNFINLKFPAEDFLDGLSVINICFLMYANDGSYAPTTAGPYSAPPNMNYWNITLRKNDYYVKNFKTFRFEKVSNQWINTKIT